MAERVRKSKPRKAEPVEEEKRYNYWQLLMMLTIGVGLIFVMIIVSGFLSNSPHDIWIYYIVGGIALLAGLLWYMSWRWNKANA